MLCEKGHLREATVHVTGVPDDSASIGATKRGRCFSMSICQTCASNSDEQLLGGVLGMDLGGSFVWQKLRVLEVTPQWTTVRLIRSEDEHDSENWLLLTARLPKPGWEVGDVVEMALGPGALEWLTGRS